MAVTSKAHIPVQETGHLPEQEMKKNLIFTYVVELLSRPSTLRNSYADTYRT